MLCRYRSVAAKVLKKLGGFPWQPAFVDPTTWKPQLPSSLSSYSLKLLWAEKPWECWFPSSDAPGSNRTLRVHCRCPWSQGHQSFPFCKEIPSLEVSFQIAIKSYFKIFHKMTSLSTVNYLQNVVGGVLHFKCFTKTRICVFSFGASFFFFPPCILCLKWGLLALNYVFATLWSKGWYNSCTCHEMTL